MERWIEKKQCAVMIGVHNAPHKPLYRVCETNPAARRVLVAAVVVSSAPATVRSASDAGPHPDSPRIRRHAGVCSVLRRLNHFRYTVSRPLSHVLILIFFGLQ
ncbi:hypothetical protein Y032_0192g1347 [Ancylostoma ceylanicum]|uniref:Uncharacterized protein n=1 Tax=Ancylostoma ceylanicum TaxID=53326 RepID=A0A016SPR3_9BILA|nr:hypothetical protein Y032_0192g1347 [Ancylostoma ceylanicum]